MTGSIYLALSWAASVAAVGRLVLHYQQISAKSQDAATYCCALLQQALLRLRGRRPDFSLVLGVLAPGKEKMEEPDSHCLSLPSAHRTTNDTGILFTETRHSHGTASTHEGYVQIGDLNISYPASCGRALGCIPHLFPRRAGCANWDLQKHNIDSNKCRLVVLSWCRKSKNSVLCLSLTSWTIWWHWLYIC